MDETRKHVEGIGRLVMRSKMTSFVDFEEGESREGLSAAGSVTADDPVFGRGGIEATLSRPLHVLNPVLAAQIVADEVFNARVDQNANAAFEDRREVLGEAGDPVTSQSDMNTIGTSFPGEAGGDTKGLLDVGLVEEFSNVRHVIAQRGDLAGDSHVVHINGSAGIDFREAENAHHSRLASTKGNGPNAGLNCRLACRVCIVIVGIELGLRKESSRVHKVRILGILVKWIHPTVSYRYSLEIDQHVLSRVLILAYDVCRKMAIVMARIRLTTRPQSIEQIDRTFRQHPPPLL